MQIENEEGIRTEFEGLPINDTRKHVEPNWLGRKRNGEYVHYWAQQLWQAFLYGKGKMSKKKKVSADNMELKIDDGH